MPDPITYRPPRRYSTHTYVTLLISESAFREISEKLRAAGYDHVFDDWQGFPGGLMDMHGIALIVDPSHEESLSLARVQGPEAAEAGTSDHPDPS